MADLLLWFSGVLTLGAIWAAFAVYSRLRARRLEHIQRGPELLIDFGRTPDQDPLSPKRPGETRISKADFTSNRQVRRPVRRYNLGEDGADPKRKP